MKESGVGKERRSGSEYESMTGEEGAGMVATSARHQNGHTDAHTPHQTVVQVWQWESPPLLSPLEV